MRFNYDTEENNKFQQEITGLVNREDFFCFGKGSYKNEYQENTLRIKAMPFIIAAFNPARVTLYQIM